MQNKNKSGVELIAEEKAKAIKKEFGKTAASMIGQENVYSDKTKNNVRVIIKDVRWSMAQIYSFKTKQFFPAIEFLCKPIDGSRAFWSKPFKQSNKPVKK